MPFEPETATRRIRIVLVRPQGAGNIGSVARVMANFGLGDLVLVLPRADRLSPDSRAMACSAQDLLESARVVDSLAAAVAGCRWVCGATARVGDRRRAELVPATAAPLALDALPSAFVFGPEDTGLSGDDLDLCHAIVTIPTASRLQSLNLAQAVAVVAYELWQAAMGRGPGGANEAEEPSRTYRTEKVEQSDRPDRSNETGLAGGGGSDAPLGPDRFQPASAEELEAALEHLRRALEAVGYFRQTAPEHPLREIRRFIARARPSRYELSMIRGMCRKTLNALRHAARQTRPDQRKG